MGLAEFFARPTFDLDVEEKRALMLRELNELTTYHRDRCPVYRRMLDAAVPHFGPAARLVDVPYLPVGLFKEVELASVPREDVFKVMTSSGTTGARVSRVYLDRETAALQARALGRIMQEFIGPKRLPMIVVDKRSTLREGTGVSARGAGILGMMSFGRDHLFALDESMRLDVEALKAFLLRHAGEPILVFGFTFMVWLYLYSVARDQKLDIDLQHAILVHSGGWKKLEDQAVDRATFAKCLRETLGLKRVHNFYGMVEQVGSVFVEGDSGYLHTPSFAEVLIRDPVTWEQAPTGSEGVIEVLSVLPRSYPGHALLTEDLGVVHGHDVSPCGRRGTYFSVVGRVPRAELRGCSDTHASGLP